MRRYVRLLSVVLLALSMMSCTVSDKKLSDMPKGFFKPQKTEYPNCGKLESAYLRGGKILVNDNEKGIVWEADPATGQARVFSSSDNKTKTTYILYADDNDIYEHKRDGIYKNGERVSNLSDIDIQDACFAGDVYFIVQSVSSMERLIAVKGDDLAVLTDDVPWGSISYYGGKFYYSPHDVSGNRRIDMQTDECEDVPGGSLFVIGDGKLFSPWEIRTFMQIDLANGSSKEIRISADRDVFYDITDLKYANGHLLVDDNNKLNIIDLRDDSVKTLRSTKCEWICGCGDWAVTKERLESNQYAYRVYDLSGNLVMEFGKGKIE